MSFLPRSDFNMYGYFLGDRIAEGLGARRALLTDRGTRSYQDVHDEAGRIANLLRGSGVQPGDRVMIALEDGPDYVATLFGIVRAGAVVVMVNPHLPAEQITYFYDYTEPVLAFVGTEVIEQFRTARTAGMDGPELVEVGDETFPRRLEAFPSDAEVHGAGPDAPAIFLFSGGTTGHPKAVVQTHRSFANTTELYGKAVLRLGPDDVTLSVPKLFFGYATGTNLFFPFSVGATSALFAERCTAETLFEKIEGFRPTLLVNVPTMVNHLVGHETASRRDLSSLRVATSAGEALPVELHRRWDRLFEVPLLDGLGTAEMWHIFISNRIDDVRPGTLGRVVDGFEVLACDDDGHQVAPGEVGTMRVRGDSLALGYWKDEEKTRAAFQDGWFVSGDMISVDDEGIVTYAGRADDMLKVSGKWLSPKELENCLLEHESVREAAVVGSRTSEGLVKPSAFVVLRDGARASNELGDELKAWAKSRLEPYKYPRTVVFLDALPRTHLGKVDRGSLARGL
ncbi:MAG: benzoate-CoA ligase family protein [Gemmatimonadota bacterium]|nr:benzoate-CoA ligase family protein [Gemmatimonadota bacterium]